MLSPVLFSLCIFGQADATKHRNLQADVVDCYGDVDSNTVVDVQDVLLVLSNFGLGGPSVADIDLDGDVDVEDILGVLSAFGDTCGDGAPTIAIGDGPFYVGEPMSVSFSGATDTYDWVGLYPVGDTPGDDSSHHWTYHGSVSGYGTTTVSPQAPGEYFVVLFCCDGYTEITERIFFQVVPTVGCYSGNGADYVGGASTTVSGITCQEWALDSPHEHGFNELPGNLCRNPDGEPSPWCYTTDPDTRWELCDIPQCPEGEPMPEPNWESTVSVEPGPYHAGEYVTVSFTGANHPLDWIGIYPAAQESYVGSHHWSYTSAVESGGSGSVELLPSLPGDYIIVMLCCDGYTQVSAEIEIIVSIAVGCYNGDGADYVGGATTTVSGLECQPWALDTPHAHNFNAIEGNYCRNPDGEPGPWCYTMDPDTRWELCDVPSCPDQDIICWDDDESIYLVAQTVGIPLNLESACTEAAMYCGHDTYGPTVHDYCPIACGDCVPPAPEPVPDFTATVSVDSSATFYTGSPLTVSFTGATDDLDWIGLYEEGHVPGEIGSHHWSYHGSIDGGSGSVEVTPTEPGAYFIVMFCCDGYTEVSARVEIYVHPTGTVSVPEGPFYVNQPIPVMFTGASVSTDWIGLYEEGDEPGEQGSHHWNYMGELVDGTGSVSVTPSSPGNYFVVLLCCDGYTEISLRLWIHVYPEIGCYDGDGIDYTGGAAVTVSGITCQDWASDVPHAHNFNFLPHNYCRNPDGEPGPWCYTTDPDQRWELCEVPQCPSGPAPEPEPFYEATLDAPTAALLGESITVSFTGATQDTDWIGIYEVGHTPGDVGSTDWSYHGSVSGDGSVDVSTGSTGDFYVVMLCCDGYTEISERVYLTVFQGSVSVTADEFALGDTISVSFTGATDANDWVGIYHQGDVPGTASSHDWSYHDSVSGDGSVDVTPTELGSYFIVLFCCDGYTEISARINILVVDPDIGCYSGDGFDYTGTASTTVSGITCQDWALDTPHEHSFHSAGPSNHCRNPDGEPGPWCYTTDPNTRWELCDVPQCPPPEPEPEPDWQVDLSIDAGPFYMGEQVTVTFSGAEDANDWVGLYQVGHEPGDVGSHDWSYHGSVSGSGSVSVTPTEANTYYAVMLCCDGYTEISDRIYFIVYPPVGCYDPDDQGASYTGTASTTITGLECQDWALDTPHEHGFNYLPSNYCRNPDGEATPWCYTMDPGTRWQLCAVPACTPAPEPVPLPEPDWQASVSVANCDELDNDAGLYAAATAAGLELPGESGACTTIAALDYCTNPTWGEAVTGFCPGACDACPPLNYLVGEPVTVSFTGANDDLDWIGIYQEGHEPGSQSSHDWSYHSTVDGVGSVDVTPMEPGNYFVVMFCCDGYTEISARTYFVVDPPVGCYDASDFGLSYTGGAAVTGTGITCQPWILDEPHEHGFNLVGTHNYCRNPDNSALPWCYTMDPDTRWEYCTQVPVCSSPEPAPEPAFSATVSVGSISYPVGSAITVSFTGATDAADWIGIYLEGQTPGSVGSTDWSYHGSVNGEGSVDVFPSEPGTYFVVMLCCDGYTEISSRVTVVVDPPIGCYNGNGADYAGGASTTVSGTVCQYWALDSPHEHNFNDLPQNYCRNPDGEPTPWCYTSDPNQRWELCAVPSCATEMTSTAAIFISHVSNAQTSNNIFGTITGSTGSSEEFLITAGADARADYTVDVVHPDLGSFESYTVRLDGNNGVNIGEYVATYDGADYRWVGNMWLDGDSAAPSQITLNAADAYTEVTGSATETITVTTITGDVNYADTSSEQQVIFYGTNGFVGPLSLGSDFAQGATTETVLNIPDIGELVEVKLTNTGNNGWYLEQLAISYNDWYGQWSYGLFLDGNGGTDSPHADLFLVEYAYSPVPGDVTSIVTLQASTVNHAQTSDAITVMVTGTQGSSDTFVALPSGIGAGESATVSVSHPFLGDFISITVGLTGNNGVNFNEIRVNYQDGTDEFTWLFDQDPIHGGWLDGDSSNPLITPSQELTLATSNPLLNCEGASCDSVTIVTVTGENSNANTNSNQMVTLYGVNGHAGPFQLDGDAAFGLGSTDTFTFTLGSIGELLAMRIENTGNDGWSVDQIDVTIEGQATATWIYGSFIDGNGAVPVDYFYAGQLAADPCAFENVYVTEAHTSGQNVDGQSEDYIEIYNDGPACTLTGWQLDDSLELADLTFAAVHLEAGQYWLGAEDGTNSFTSGLSSGGDEVHFCDAAGQCHSIVLGPSDGTDAQCFDSLGNGCYCDPTPGTANTECHADTWVATVDVADGVHYANEPITVTFTGATDDADWIGIYLQGQTPGDVGSTDWSYHGSVSGEGSVEVTPPSAGEYFIVMLCCDGYTEISARYNIAVLEVPPPGAGPGSDMYIAHIADPNSAASARFVQLYNPTCDPIDLGSTLFELRRWTNGNADYTASTVIPLTGTVLPQTVFTVCKNMAEFAAAYPGRTCDLEGGDSGPADSNGDDQIALFKADDLIDIFGVPGEDGTGTDHEFEDGQAYRVMEGPNAVWTVAEWVVNCDSSQCGPSATGIDGIIEWSPPSTNTVCP